MVDKGTIWRNIDDLNLWERNPNEGDIGSIMGSIRDNGYNDTCHEWNDIIKGGNHSIIALRILRNEGWHPDKCAVDSTCLDIVNGDWLVSIVDISHMSDVQSDAFALAINRTQRLGMDDPVKLAELLQDIFASNKVVFEATGYSPEDLDEVLRDLGDGISWDYGEQGNISRDIMQKIHGNNSELIRVEIGAIMTMIDSDIYNELYQLMQLGDMKQSFENIVLAGIKNVKNSYS